ncbi:PREDICTED: BSD domain-containing protein 1 [Ipomoea nil]|uniref:BSD domain-containing protein 1 n=1 Tax=Ipomoea nil TaxID=35883 RepID=UPI0009014FA6|nr:PREDICTED: BSD domain-containing protein 1 [Ipomoea nil]
MDFFKSILADDPEPENVQDSKQHSPSPSSQKEENREETEGVDGADPSTTASGASRWGSFGGLIKTLASRSESVLETYRRDLEEFGTGLKKETVLFREVASRAVKELPASIEVGASVAHGSLGSVGKTIDGVFKSTADIISQGKDTLLSSSDAEPETPDTNRSSDSRRYSRFDAQLTTIRNDPATFTDEPEDLDEYRKWKSEFNLNDKRPEFEELIGENGGLDGVYKRLVPSVVDEDTFWCRYFYRVHKLKQQESVRASLVMRAISVDDEEELTWDVDDDDDNDYEPNCTAKSKGEEQGNSQASNQDSGKITDELQNVSSDISDEKGSVTGSSENSFPKEKEAEEATLLKSVEKGVPSGKQNDACEQQPVQEEEDFGWDEIEDIESGDEKKALTSRGESANIADLRKKLADDDDDENLGWDIEDDDEPIKA